MVCYHAKNNKYPRILNESVDYYDGLDIWKLSDVELMAKCKLEIIYRPQNRTNETNSTNSTAEEEFDKELLEFIIVVPTKEPEIPKPELPALVSEPTYETFTIAKQYVNPKNINPIVYEDILCYGIHVEKCQDGIIVIINTISQGIKEIYIDIRDFFNRCFNNQNKIFN